MSTQSKDQHSLSPVNESGGGTNKAPLSSKIGSDGELWSFLRSVMMQGVAISHDYQHEPYEKYSARLDIAAVERQSLRPQIRESCSPQKSSLGAT
jgi:hypothetical protein